MRALRFALNGLAREWRSGELAVLIAALLVAVTAMTAVGLFTDRVRKAVAVQAAEILAADLVVSSADPIDAALEPAALDAGMATARTLVFPSVVLAGERQSLARIKGVTDGYPLRGRLRIGELPFGDSRTVDGLPEPGQVWLDPRLMARLDVAVGDTVAVGQATMTIAAVLAFAPDQEMNFTTLAPVLLLNLADIEATGLVSTGSRVTHQLLMAGDEGARTVMRERLDNSLPTGHRLRDISTGRPEIRTASQRAEQFLGLSALVAVLLAAVAVGMAARRYADKQLDGAALMKCLGAQQGFLVRITLLQMLVLGLMTGVAGAILGYAAQALRATLVADLLSASLPQPGLRSAAAGLWTSAILLAGFAMPALMHLKNVPPLRVLRHDAGSGGPRQWLVYGAAAIAITALLFWLIQDIDLVVRVLSGALVAVVVLALAGWALVAGVSRLRGGGGAAWRYGLASIGRRGADSVVQVVAFGLGLTVLLLAIVRNDLLDTWRASLPEDAPNHFLINVQPEEVDALYAFFRERDRPKPLLMPLVRARITAINDTPIADMTFDSLQGRRFAERDSNLTFADALREDNTLVEGEWWDPAQPAVGEVSVEVDFARNLGLKVGDRITHNIAGELVEATVTSLRTVEWESFRPNFFMVFSPPTLEGLPATWVGSLYMPSANQPVLLDLAREFPGVSAIDIDAAIAQVRGVMDKASLAVEYVFGFTLLAGITVLLAAVMATRDQRRFESAMLRTLGASRSTVFAGVATEFVVLGALAGLLAAICASLAGYSLATAVFKLDYGFSPLIWLTGLAAGMAIVGAAGVWATRSAVNAPPMLTLRA
ncbi:MAG: FtsX-like permease family protein [Pseudomonadota bacterium]